MRTAGGFATSARPGLGILGCLILTVIGLAGCSSEDQESRSAETQAPTVLVAPVTERVISTGESKVAHTRAIHRVRLKARVSGALEARAFKAGDRVDEDQLLFAIEPDQYQADVSAAKAAVAEAKAAHDKANQYLKRLKSVARGGVSASDLEKAETEAAAAKARLSQARAKQQSAQLKLGYTQIHAPIAGRISRTQVDTGNLIGPDSGVLATIVQLDPIYVEFTVSERETTRFLLNQNKDENEQPALNDYRLRLRLSGGSLYDQTGRLDYVANEVDRSTGTLAMRAVFDNPDGLLRPGQFVTALITGAEPEKRLLVPQTAVQQDKKGRYVFVVDSDNQVTQQRVELGDRQKINWVVQSGLGAGDRVVFEGLQKIHPDMTVDPRSGDPSAGLGKDTDTAEQPAAPKDSGGSDTNTAADG